jgi:hypothetical protein
MDKETIIWLVGIAIFVSSIIGSMVYVEYLTLECKQFGMEKGISASEIQVICR